MALGRCRLITHRAAVWIWSRRHTRIRRCRNGHRVHKGRREWHLLSTWRICLRTMRRGGRRVAIIDGEDDDDCGVFYLWWLWNYDFRAMSFMSLCIILLYSIGPGYLPEWNIIMHWLYLPSYSWQTIWKRKAKEVRRPEILGLRINQPMPQCLYRVV